MIVMNFDDIIAKLKLIEKSLLERHPEISRDKKFQILTRSTKVSEEYGELANEVLAYLMLQRQEKLSDFKKENLEKEFGDVFNSLILLGFALDIDVKMAVVDRINEMYERYGHTN